MKPILKANKKKKANERKDGPKGSVQLGIEGKNSENEQECMDSIKSSAATDASNDKETIVARRINC